jgi:hypothetical protein
MVISTFPSGDLARGAAAAAGAGWFSAQDLVWEPWEREGAHAA